MNTLTIILTLFIFNLGVFSPYLFNHYIIKSKYIQDICLTNVKYEIPTDNTNFQLLSQFENDIHILKKK